MRSGITPLVGAWVAWPGAKIRMSGELSAGPGGTQPAAINPTSATSAVVRVMRLTIPPKQNPRLRRNPTAALGRPPDRARSCGHDQTQHPVGRVGPGTVSYTHLRAHETDSYLVCRL